jgi:hypothetical protein
MGYTMSFMKKTALATAIVAMGLVTTAASAATYSFSESWIGGTVVHGTFSGTAMAGGNDITNISNLSVFGMGFSYTAPIYLQAYSGSGPAVLSLNGEDNNIRVLFGPINEYTATYLDAVFVSLGQAAATSTTYAGRTLQQYSPGDRNQYQIAGYACEGCQNNWSAIAVAAPVPEPEEWALLLAGLPLVGWKLRNKKAAHVAHVVA